MSYYQTIYNRLRQLGFTEAGALGMLGNWDCESNCEPFRLQNDFSSTKYLSKNYTQGVMNGSISRQQFGTDEKGYGLAQWTYVNAAKTAGRKFNLYDFWKKSGRALDDPIMQCDFCWWEITVGGYAHVKPTVTLQTDLYTAVDKICRLYEQPYQNNVQARFEAAQRIKGQIDLNGWKSTAGQEEKPSDSAAPGADPGQEPEPSQPKLETWPPRVIDSHCSGWPEVWLLQALLKNHGLNVLVDGIFGDALSNKVRQWQRDNGLTPDGAVGPMSWTSLGISPEAFKK